MIHRLIFSFALFVASFTFSYGQVNKADSVDKKEVVADSATVYVDFMVETTGKISNIKVSKIICKKCSKEFKESIKSEAIRVVGKMPDQGPLEEKVLFTLPIKFRIVDEIKNKPKA